MANNQPDIVEPLAPSTLEIVPSSSPCKDASDFDVAEEPQDHDTNHVRQSFQRKKKSKTLADLAPAQKELSETGIWSRKKIWFLMEEPSLNPVAEKIHNCYSGLIFLSVLTKILATLETLSDNVALEILEIVFNVLFSFEAAVRIFCSPQKRALLKNSYMWMDILAVLPFYVFLFFQDVDSDDNMFLELILLLVPILRLLKITRHSSGWKLLVISMKLCLEPLMVPGFFMVLMVVFSSCLIFWLDKHFAPKGDGAAFQSIPHTMWFAIVTVSTVGYGDVSPHSDLGKTASSALILIGVCYMAMPLAIVGNTFSEVWKDGDRILIAEKSKAKFSAEGFTKDQLAELFEAIDDDGSGALSRKEFVSLIETFNLGFTKAQIKKLYWSIDEDHTGTVNFQEFCDFLFPEIEIDDEECTEEPFPSSKPPGPQPDKVDCVHEILEAASFQEDEGTNGACFMTEVCDEELDAKMQDLEQSIKSLQKDAHDGFNHVRALLGISAAAPSSQSDQKVASQKSRSTEILDLPGVVCTTPEPGLPIHGS